MGGGWLRHLLLLHKGLMPLLRGWHDSLILAFDFLILSYPSGRRSDGWNVDDQTEQRAEHVCVSAFDAALLQGQQTPLTTKNAPGADYVGRRERGTDHGVQKGLPAVWIVSKAVTDDIISGQTVDCSNQQGEDVLTGLTDISLERLSERRHRFRAVLIWYFHFNTIPRFLPWISAK